MTVGLYAIANLNEFNTLDSLDNNLMETIFGFVDDDTSTYKRKFDAYYPPLYQNKIKVSKDRLVDDDGNLISFNYLILSKYADITNGQGLYGSTDGIYCYFIKEITYVNDDLYELTIKMDTIMTYAGCYDITDAVLERESICRYTYSGAINRNYVRENLSKCDVVNTTYEHLKPQMNFYLVTTDIDYDTDRVNKPTRVRHLENVVSTGRYMYLIPDVKGMDGNKFIYLYELSVWSGSRPIGTMTFSSGDIITLIQNLAQDSHVQSIQYLTSYMINTHFPLSISTVNVGTAEQPLYQQNIRFGFISSDASYQSNPFMKADFGSGTASIRPAVGVSIFPTSYISHMHNFNIDKNVYSYVDEEMNYHKVPYILDENYIQLSFGERMCLTQAPLSKSKQGRIYCTYQFDPISGFRNYGIRFLNDTYLTEPDNYLTNTTCATIQMLDLYTDAWKDYQVRNVGTLTTGVKYLAANNIYNGFKTMAGSATTNYTGGYNEGTMFNRVGGLKEQRSSVGASFNQSGGMVQAFNPTKIATGASDMAVNLMNQQAQLQVNRENLQATPDTSRSGNTFLNDYINQASNIVLIKNEVRDIEQVARYVEWYGYKVNKVHSYYYLYAKNRGLFNVHKFSNLNLSIHRKAYTLDIIADLRSRLLNGVRIFTVYSMEIENWYDKEQPRPEELQIYEDYNQIVLGYQLFYNRIDNFDLRKE